MGIYLIAARSKNNVIGVDGEIPWDIPGEQSQFKELTKGNAVIMGRKTYEEIGRPLPGRLNIVVSKTTTFKGEVNLVTVWSLGEGIQKAREMGYQYIYIAGGAMLYKEAIHIVDKMYLTTVDTVIVPENSDAPFASSFRSDNITCAEGNVTFFPNFSSGDFTHTEGEWQGDTIKYRREVYTRKPKKGAIFHKYLLVNEKDKQKAGFEGDLADFAAERLTEWKMSENPDAKIVSIEKSHRYNRNAWYEDAYYEISIWLEQQ